MEHAAVEAGISRAAVRQALVELQSGLLETPSARRRLGVLGPAASTLTRTVPGPVDRVERFLGRFLREQLFEMRRYQGSRTTWVRRRGIEASARRAVDRALQHRLILRDVHHVDVCLHDHDNGWVLVRLDVDVLAIRHRQGTVAGTATVLGGGVAATTALVASVSPALLAATAIGGGVAGAGMWAGRSIYRRRVGAIEFGLGGMLDQLEHRVPAL